MTEQQINDLNTKIKNGTSTPEEELELLKFLNQGIEELRFFLKEVSKDRIVENIISTTSE